MPMGSGHFDQFLCHCVGDETPTSLVAASFLHCMVRPMACDPTLDIDIDTKHPAKSGDRKINVAKNSLSPGGIARHEYRRIECKRHQKKRKCKPGSRRSSLWWGLVLFRPNRDWPGRGGWESALRHLAAAAGGRGRTRPDRD